MFITRFVGMVVCFNILFNLYEVPMWIKWWLDINIIIPRLSLKMLFELVLKNVVLDIKKEQKKYQQNKIV